MRSNAYSRSMTRLPHAVRAAILEPALLGTALPGRIPLVKKAVSYVEQARVADAGTL